MTQADTPSPPPPDLEDLEALVLEVFARVWEEFSAADAEYCETTIGSLAATSVAEDSTLSIESESTAAQPHDICRLGSRASSVGTSTPGPSKPHIPRVCVETDFPTLILPPAVEPYPEHECWTPADRSIFRGDDCDDMQFFPFADEPAFDKRRYRKFFKTLAWQGGEQMDADRESSLQYPPLCCPTNCWTIVELIVLEAAHRLHFDYGIELERIDEANVLPFTLLGNQGLIHRASQRYFNICHVRRLPEGDISLRDLFEWSGAARTNSFPLPRPPVPDVLDLRGRLKSLHGDFCPRLNCIDFYCSVHKGMRTNSQP